MRDEITSHHIVPPAVLSWQEEQTRFAFQNGEAAFMRNWPYAATLLEGSRGDSRVTGRFGVTSMPAGEGGARARHWAVRTSRSTRIRIVPTTRMRWWTI